MSAPQPSSQRVAAAAAPPVAASNTGTKRPAPAPLSAAASAPNSAAPSPSAAAAAARQQKIVIPPVPSDSWYASPLKTMGHPYVADFHAKNRGRVLFAPVAVPTSAAGLDGLPGGGPVTQRTFDVGRDLLYGIGYLHSTALATEHRWRGRVSHLHAVKAGRAVVPESIRRANELTRLAEERRNSSSNSTSKNIAIIKKEDDGGSSSSGNGLMNLQRAEASIYQSPPFDVLVGLKVYVNDELVADHYPGPRSLPQCTATLDTPDAVSKWNCVPFVLIGALNHPTLDTIDLYRTLSLSFVEHLLRLKFPPLPTTAAGGASNGGGRGSVGGGGRSSPSPAAPTSSSVSPSPSPSPSAAAARGAQREGLEQRGAPPYSRSGSQRGRTPPPSLSPAPPGTRVMELRLRVEVVYGCRAEAYFCTDFIARGGCTLFMADTAKASLKGYEEKLRALVRARRSSEQIIRTPQPDVRRAPVRVCGVCGNELLFCCTVCGADFCGSLMCSRRELSGYPCGCTIHKAMLT